MLASEVALPCHQEAEHGRLWQVLGASQTGFVPAAGNSALSSSIAVLFAMRFHGSAAAWARATSGVVGGADCAPFFANCLKRQRSRRSVPWAPAQCWKCLQTRSLRRTPAQCINDEALCCERHVALSPFGYRTCAPLIGMRRATHVSSSMAANRFVPKRECGCAVCEAARPRRAWRSRTRGERSRKY